ncbi:adenylate/guanylate cyclase domain-containing protein [Ruegeria sp. HKCCD6428]|uniref:adenylate/guanylate cyclase domain-containing protein n=1 Tax=Ruegeria sp. HKCCD6428 TaxID=2683002 RepID=UPI00149209D2|nr:adenylate/guanylate cyclase domain-containing protein [Ruegeria sp. HKCCD6428]NOC83034.1 FHA domain-containing protein [Ruegeria sp. HKCCD6428]
MKVVGAALVADVSNSTPLFEELGEQAALREINHCLQEMRTQIQYLGGAFLHSKGDDVLAFFEDANAALEVAQTATQNIDAGALQVHAGLSWGSMLRLPNDLYGTPVNIASRLASLAKPREVLVCEPFLGELSTASRGTLREVDVLSLKGVSDRLKVHSYVAEDPVDLTMKFASHSTASEGSLSVVLRYEAAIRELSEGSEVSLGRAEDADLVVPQPWVSRKHATVSVMNGIVVLRDHSTLGSFVRMDEGREIVARRGSVTLIGNGAVSLGAPFAQSSESVVRYSQTRSFKESAQGQ